MGELALGKNADIFCEQAKDHPRHEQVHVVATRWSGPVRVYAHQRVIKLCQFTSSGDIDRIFFCRLIAILARRRQQERKVHSKLGKCAMQGIARLRMLSRNRIAIGSDEDCGFAAGRLLACAQRSKRFLNRPPLRRSVVKALAEQYATRQIGFVGRAPQLGDGRLGTISRVCKCKAELGRVERLFRNRFECVGNLGRVHGKSNWKTLFKHWHGVTSPAR